MKNDKFSGLQTAETRGQYEKPATLYNSLLERFARIPNGSLSILGYIQSRDAGTLPLAHLQIGDGSDTGTKRVLVTAGFHGDEPAGVLALLRFLEEELSQFPGFSIHAFPCLNPIGFVRRHRLGSTHHDLNRVIDSNSIAPETRLFLEKLALDDSRFDAVLDLHEDNPEVPCDFAPEEPAPDAFYLYESTRDNKRSLSSSIVKEVHRSGYPVSPWQSIYGDAAVNGVISFSKRKAALYDFERYAIETLTNSIVTTETPMEWRLEDRVAAQVAVLRGAFRALSGPRASCPLNE